MKRRFVTISVKGDRTHEPDETFFVNLSNPSANSYFDDGQGQATIKTTTSTR